MIHIGMAIQGSESSVQHSARNGQFANQYQITTRQCCCRRSVRTRHQSTLLSPLLDLVTSSAPYTTEHLWTLRSPIPMHRYKALTRSREENERAAFARSDLLKGRGNRRYG